MIWLHLPFPQSFIQFKMVTIQQLSKHQNNDTQSLDLRSSKTDKIHRIQSLQRFHNLRNLNLSNNMIVKMQNLSSLLHLKILNLQFNQITKIQGIKTLSRLQQLVLSYNSIENISNDIKCNQSLRVLHIAYNNIKSIQNIRPLSILSSLSILSLVGNPFLSALNYVAFIKMLIPSLILLDDRDANQSIIAANVYPHEEIFILRDALNKLLDQRNNMSNQSGHFQTENSRKNMTNSKESPQRQGNQQLRATFSNDQQNVITLLEQWISSYQRKLQVKKIQINQLSQDYSQCMRNSIVKPSDKYQIQIIQKINKYRAQQEKGLLSSQKKHKLHKLSKDLQKTQYLQNKSRQQSRNVLQMLKNKQSDYSKLKQKQQILKELQYKIESNPQIDTNKIIMAHLLYGNNTNQGLGYRQLKKYLYDSKGFLYYLKMLNLIIFGEEADSQRIFRLKEFLGDKCLIQIINNLKQMGLKHKKQKKKYEKQRTKLIQKFQTQAQELCQQWKQLQKQRSTIRNSRNAQNIQIISKPILDERFSLVQAEQRKKIMLLKKQKQHYENKLNQMQANYQSLQLQFQRKYKELQEFQRFFQQFKNQKETVNSLKEQIQQTSKQLNNKKIVELQLQQSIKQLSIKESTLLQKSSFFQRKLYQRTQELKLVQQKLKSSQQKTKKINDQFNTKNYQLISMQQQISKTIQQMRQYDKKIQRQKSTLEMYQQKFRNLSELQNNKRNNLTNLQSQVDIQRKHLTEIYKNIEQAQEKLNKCMQSSYQYQLKIQQNKKSIESLSDINKVISDMMQRQNQLKRSVMQLQLQNQHLLQVKSKLINQIKIQYDDQDDSL